MSSPSSRLTVGLALATIYLVWGSTYLAIRVAVETMPPFAMAAGRFLIAGSLLFGFLKFRGAPRPTARQWFENSIIGTLLLVGGNGLVGWAEQEVPSGVAALLIGVGPLFIVLTEWAWQGGQRPTALTMVALGLGLIGVAWLAAPWEQSGAHRLPPVGVGVIMAACLFWAIGSIYSRHARSGAGPLMSASLQMLGGGGALIVVGLLTGDFRRLEFAAISTHSWWSFVYLIVVGSLIGFCTFVWLMKNVPPALAATHAFVNPLVAVVLGWWLLDEEVSSRTFVATAIIITAVVIITVQKNRTRLAIPPRQAVGLIDAKGKVGNPSS